MPDAYSWELLLPAIKGALPLGGTLCRTDPGGNPLADTLILGVYPAQTGHRLWQGRRVPVAVERTSFEPTSKSGADLERYYLAPLGLRRDDVFLVDLMPYFFARTARGKKSGRSAWDNLVAHAEATGESCAALPQPLDDDMLAASRNLAGNLERLACYIQMSQASRLLTLGNIPAAFVRGFTKAKKAQPFLYSPPITADVVGKQMEVTHLAHPGILHNASWIEQHRAWLQTAAPW